MHVTYSHHSQEQVHKWVRFKQSKNQEMHELTQCRQLIGSSPSYPGRNTHPEFKPNQDHNIFCLFVCLFNTPTVYN